MTWLESVAAVATALVIGVGIGVLLSRPRSSGDGEVEDRTRALGAASPAARDVLEALPVAVLVIDRTDQVLLDNRAARDLGLVSGGVLVSLPQLRRMVRSTRANDAPQEGELEVPLARPGRAPVVLRARLAPVGDGSVGVLLEDVTEARRVEDVRRDFVANVSHELKTPVGAMALLAEALLDASSDPNAVRRFAGRVQHEAGRLGRLVQELLDLSRLQGADPLPEPALVSVDRVVAEAVDRTRTAATARTIAVVQGGTRGLQVMGSEAQLVTAVANLIDNALAYSPAQTNIAVAARPVGTAVEITVTDQGMGIPDKDLERIFERFYRSDPARSRATGGTGLGLAIVKHVATNHGGEVTVWSAPGSGSTFTITLPAAQRKEEPA
ncbi:MAG TPA: ATP-binding protein [Mycobacteriales bacterium]|nr:ATP-binding protein [Mycobacteriales bacterium]